MSADIGYLQTKITELKDSVDKILIENEKIKMDNTKLLNQYSQLQTTLTKVEVDIDALGYLADSKNEFEEKLRKEMLDKVLPIIKKYLDKNFEKLREADCIDIKSTIQKQIFQAINCHENLIVMRLNTILGLWIESISIKMSNTDLVDKLKKLKFSALDIKVGEEPLNKKDMRGLV